MPIKSRIRTIPDYPKPGIMFRDITTLLQDPVGFRLTVDGLAKPFKEMRIDKIAGVEARGFIVGGAVAQQLDAGFVPVRKKGKLPWTTIGRDYELEYGTDRIEVHTDAIIEGEQILLIDDLLATGGTASATVELLRKLGADVCGCAFIIELTALKGRARLDVPVDALVAYED